MAFKVFHKGSAPVPSVPAVTIQKRGLFSVNDAAYRLIGEPEGVQFLWEEDSRRIGIQGVPLESPNAYPARRQGTGKYANRSVVLIAGTMFSRYIGLDTTVAKRWVPTVENGMLVIDLKLPAQLATSPRGRSAQVTSFLADDS
ncbi:hypothetical protein QFZ52_002681 [Arthrobacter woluwensis]|uniref:hypothetical protein n=1 Tax=Arthrobacter woluwensis TaxID=156980 RepID=UPI00277EC274|nr:hypothetical protein [Arthrobacter woluwensis]MDQ0710029.1 hypothetical protein [Arthrobacter woluwensis]